MEKLPQTKRYGKSPLTESFLATCRLPHILDFTEGHNRVIGTSTPGTEAYCTTFEGGPKDSIIPYFPGHERISMYSPFQFQKEKN